MQVDMKRQMQVGKRYLVTLYPSTPDYLKEPVFCRSVKVHSPYQTSYFLSREIEGVFYGSYYWQEATPNFSNTRCIIDFKEVVCTSTNMN